MFAAGRIVSSIEDLYNEFGDNANQLIDINLNLFRELPLNFNSDSIRWYFHLTGIHAHLHEAYVQVANHDHFQNKIVIIRSTRRKNYLIN